MGVKLFKNIDSEKTTLKELKGKTFAVDASLFLHQFLTSIRQPDGSPLTNSKGNITSHLIGLFYRTTKLMNEGLKLCYVFDGTHPELKKQEVQRRAEIKRQAQEKYNEAQVAGDAEAMRKYSARTVRLTDVMVAEAKQLLELLGIPIVQAPSEAEAQAALLTRQKKVWAVASQDADTLVFGASRLVRNLAIVGRRRKGLRTEIVQPEILTQKNVLEQLQLNQDQLIVLAMLIGTDFNVGGIPRIGPKKGAKLISEYSDFNELFKTVEWDKHFGVPWKQVFDVFKDIPVNEDVAISWGAIQAEEIRTFLIDECEFSADRVNNTLKKLQQTNAVRAQKGLSDFL